MEPPALGELFLLNPLHSYFPDIIYCGNRSLYCGALLCNLTGSFDSDGFWVPCEEDDYPNACALDNYWAACGLNTRFATHWVDCYYSLSSTYGPTPRYIFYALTLLSIFGRKRAWVVNVALVTVMVYSATASLHAIVLASFTISTFSSTFSAMRSNYEVVLVQGYSETGMVEPGSTINWSPTWMPVLPMVYDPDPGAILGILAVTYLCLIPMQLRSRTIKTLDKRRRYLIRIWMVLIALGLAGAFATRIFMSIWYTLQVRFCPWTNTRPQSEVLPRYIGQDTAGLPTWDRQNRYRLNDTLNTLFPQRNDSELMYPGDTNFCVPARPDRSCLYPCADFWWPTRDPTDIYVTPLVWISSTSSATHPDSFTTLTAYLVIMAAGWYLLSLTVNMSIFLASKCARSARSGTPDEREVKYIGIRPSIQAMKNAWQSTGPFARKLGKLVAPVSMFLVAVFAWITTGLGLVLLGVSEYTIWTSDPPLQAEGLTHVGQWGILASTVLLLGGVFFTIGYQPLSNADLPL